MKNEFIQKRKAYFERLLEIYPSPEVSTELAPNRFTPWNVIGKEDVEKIVMDTGLQRLIFPNEIVFDIDGKSWSSCLRLASNLENVLSELGIPFNRWSSGRWLHYHVFCDDSQVVQTRPAWYLDLIRLHFGRYLKKQEIEISELIKFQQEVFRAFGWVICENVEPVKGAHFDPLKFSSLRCLIRAEGSLNWKTRAYKTFLAELPKTQPLVRMSWKVEFPEEVSIWKPEPKIFDDLFLCAYWGYVRPNYVLGRREKVPKKRKHRIRWIEKLLKTPLSDGRKRCINLILAPYLVNLRKLSKEKAFETIMGWLKKCEKLRRVDIRENFVRYQLKYAERKGLLPLSKGRLSEWFRDVREVISLVR